MLNITSVNIGGTCKLQSGDIEVAYFNANYSKNGNFSVNKSVINKEAYDENREQIDSDFLNFEQMIVQYIDSMEI